MDNRSKEPIRGTLLAHQAEIQRKKNSDARYAGILQFSECTPVSDKGTLSDILTRPEGLIISSDMGALGYDGNIWLDTEYSVIALEKFGELTCEGVTYQAVYTFFKTLWKTQEDFRKFHFPMGGISPDHFFMKNGWQFALGTNLIRRGFVN